MAVSTVTFIISTAEELQENEYGVTEFPLVVTIIDIIDNLVVIFFSVELMIRVTICPDKKRFMKDPMNIIDFFAILPFFLSLLLEGLEDYQIIGKTGKIIRLIRVMRILRVFKLVRHFAGLQSIFMTLQQAYQVSISSYKHIFINIIFVYMYIVLYFHSKKYCLGAWSFTRVGRRCDPDIFESRLLCGEGGT